MAKYPSASWSMHHSWLLDDSTTDLVGQNTRPHELVTLSGQDSDLENQPTTTADRRGVGDLGINNGEVGHDKEDNDYPKGFRLVAIVVALVLSIFMMAFDLTIVATALPKITSEYGLADVSWYSSAFFMTIAGFQSSWGKIFKYFPLKPGFMTALAIFEIGAIICGVAPSSTVLIIGRAISGVGAAGLSSGCFIIAGFTAPPERRPLFIGLVGAAYGVGEVLGPLLGGVLTDRLSWRWCFYINLPVGAISAVCMVFFFVAPRTAKVEDATLKEKLLQLDPVGVVLVMGLAISYVLALQYAGNRGRWSDADIIGLLVAFALITIIFIFWEWFQGEQAMMVPRIILQRDVGIASAVIFFYAGSFFALAYYMPLYFQAIGGATPIMSGVRNLPLILTGGLTSMAAGAIISATGVVTPILVLSGFIATVAAGLLYTLDIDTSTGEWVGYQILAGFGYGMGLQIPIIIGQTRVPQPDMALATSIVLFFQTMGGSMLVSAAETGFASTMRSKVAEVAPSIPAELVMGTGATDLRTTFGDQAGPILVAYMSGLKTVFAVTIASRGLATLLSFLLSWDKLDTARLKNPDST